MNSLHSRVRAARRRAKLTQAQVAERAGISLRTYQMFETGKTTPQGANLQAILEQFPDLADEAADAQIAERTREEWPTDVRVFLDVMGAYLSTMDEQTRLAYIADRMRQIVQNSR